MVPRRILFALVAAALGAGLTAAPAAAAQDPYLELLRQDVQAEKTAILTEAMMLDAKQSEAFWPLYREYSTELEKISDSYVKLIQGYADAYMSMDEATARRIAQQSLSLEADRTKLKKKTFGKMDKALGAVVAARWLQVENQLLNLIHLQVQSALPLIEATGEDD